MDPIKYFSFFRYVPTVTEYLRFAQNKQIPANLKVVKDRVVNLKNQKFLKETLRRQQISNTKLRRRLWLIKLLGNIPGVIYIGISGTVSMLNAKQEDDIDLFIITKGGQLFTVRFWLILVTSLLGVRRKRQEDNPKDKFCLNLFFSEENLLIPSNKQNLYVAHEIGQLKTVINKEQVYERFLWINRWIRKYFPNFPLKRLSNAKLQSERGGLERILMSLQMWLINRHRTTEVITDTQLWFFPDDFERKLDL